MGTIFGGIGDIDPNIIRGLQAEALKRGRGKINYNSYPSKGRGHIILGVSQSIYTMEPDVLDQEQPFDGIVHDGIIANDKQLGNGDGDLDSMVLPHVFQKRDTILDIQEQVLDLTGSYALAISNGATVYLVTNHKPLYYWSPQPGTVYFSSMAFQFKPVLPFGQFPVKLKPYSILDLVTGQMVHIPRITSGKVLMMMSGGLDSTVALDYLLTEEFLVDLLFFDYGQRNRVRESQAVHAIGEHYGCEVITLTIPWDQIGDPSPLLDPERGITVGSHGVEYPTEWVVGRNLVLSSLAVAYAESHRYSWVGTGFNLEDSGAYPDQDMEFIHLFNQLVDHSVGVNRDVSLQAPLSDKTKQEIVQLGIRGDVPMDLTWSCHLDGETPCGDCGPCMSRKIAFHRNQITTH